MHHHLKCTAAAVALAFVLNSHAGESALKAGKTTSERKALLQRIETLEKLLSEMQQAVLAQQGQAGKIGQPVQPTTTDSKKVVARLNEMEARLSNVETTAVLSEPKTAVKQIQVYVDADGNQHDHPVDGAVPTLTYQRERVYRRQTIREEIEEALAAEKNGGIELGVSNVTTAQMAFQTRGITTPANRHAYGLSAADVTFRAKSAALNTEFFADLVGIGGSAPDQEISAVNLLNSQAARLSNNQLNLREAWIRTELLNQKLGLSIGRLDLTNYFDRNVVANDETERFISDALVNNPVLGLTTNGLGFAAIYDSKSNINFKLGMQQSSTAATSLSTSLYSLAEVEYIARPFSLPEGHYRLWSRRDNSTGSNKTGAGVSFDQKLTPAVTLFGRYGSGYVGSVGGTMKFYSGGLAFQAPYTFNPLDMWGIGYAQTELSTGNTEKLAEAFYNLRLADHLSLSFMLQYVMESKTRENYLIPGLRMKVSF